MKMKYRSFFSALAPVSVILAGFSPIWGPFLVPYPYVILICSVVLYLIYLQLSVAIRLFMIVWRMKKHDKTRREERKNLLCNTDSYIKHVIVIPNYKERVSTLRNTLDQISSHAKAKTHYIVCLAQEMAEPDSDRKALGLVEEYQGKFLKLMWTHHPQNLPGESRGKAANISWAIKRLKEIVVDQERLCSLSEVIVTCPDADSIVPEAYFQDIDTEMSKKEGKEDREFFFLPVIAWAQNSLHVPVLVRLTDILLCIFYNQNLLNFFGIHFPYSTFSLPLQLIVNVDYWDTGADASGDDLHIWLKCYFETLGRLKTYPIYTPVLLTNVEASSYWGTLKARYWQAYRHYHGVHDISYSIARACYYGKKIPLIRTIGIILRVIEADLFPPVMFFLVTFIGIWKFLPFRFAPELLILGTYLGPIMQGIGLSIIFWAIGYEILHNHAVKYFNMSHETRKMWRLLEWIFGSVVTVLYSALPCGAVCLFKWSLASIKDFNFVVAPKPDIVLKTNTQTPNE